MNNLLICPQLQQLVELDTNKLKNEIITDEHLKNSILNKAQSIMDDIKDSFQENDDISLVNYLMQSLQHITTNRFPSKTSWQHQGIQICINKKTAKVIKLFLEINSNSSGEPHDFEMEPQIRLKVEFDDKNFVEIVIDSDGFPIEFSFDREIASQAVKYFEAENLQRYCGFKHKEIDFPTVIAYFIIKVAVEQFTNGIMSESMRSLLLSGCCQMCLVQDKQQVKNEEELDHFWDEDEEMIEQNEEEMMRKKKNGKIVFQKTNLKRKKIEKIE